MNEAALQRLLRNPALVKERLKEHERRRQYHAQRRDPAAVKGHLLKARHNLSFTNDTRKKYPDWALVGCYYAAYHAALALILNAGFNSKNHDATLCLLITAYYQRVSTDDLTLLNRLALDEEDILFYVQAKEEREKASYASSKFFDERLVNEVRVKTILFVNKAREILSTRG